MSTVKNTKHVWSITNDTVDSKYEKCRNITEEIYKRINITFQIKKLETAVQSDGSDQSDQIDSNELSNETDLFACDKSSISSSTEAERPACEKYININNNEETKKKTVVLYKRPRKRFRKRVKKRQSEPSRSDSDCSSDEALPLSRMVDIDTKSADGSRSETDIMGVPKIVIVTKDLKPKIKQSDKMKSTTKQEPETPDNGTHEETTAIEDIDNTIDIPKAIDSEETKEKATKEKSDGKSCTLCSLSFRGERGLRRHMTMSHISSSDDPKTRTEREVKPA